MEQCLEGLISDLLIMALNPGLAIFFLFFPPKWDKKWVLACQSFGDCAARVKLELTDFKVSNFSLKYFYLLYVQHQNPLLIINLPLIQTEYKATILRKKPLKKNFWHSNSGFEIHIQTTSYGNCLVKWQLQIQFGSYKNDIPCMPDLDEFAAYAVSDS